MCRLENCEGMKFLGEGKVEKSKLMVYRGRMKMWMIPGMMTILLWTCVVQLMGLGEMRGPRLLKGWPSCFNPADMFSDDKLPSVPPRVLPPKSEL